MNTLLIVVVAAFLIQIATSFAPQIRIRNCNAISKRTLSPFTAIYSGNEAPELQPMDEEPQVISHTLIKHENSFAHNIILQIHSSAFCAWKGRQLSGTMRDKMKRELQSQGGDPNYSAGPIAGNPILIISGVIAILVILGGKGYFF